MLRSRGMRPWIALGVVIVLVAAAIAYVVHRRDGLKVAVHNDAQVAVENVRIGLGPSPRWGIRPDAHVRREAIEFARVEPGEVARGVIHFEGEAGLLLSFEIGRTACTESGAYVEGQGYEVEIRITGCDRVGVGTSVWP